MFTFVQLAYYGVTTKTEASQTKIMSTFGTQYWFGLVVMALCSATKLLYVKPLVLRWATIYGYTILVYNRLPRPAQPTINSNMEKEYRPKCGYAVQFGIKGSMHAATLIFTHPMPECFKYHTQSTARSTAFTLALVVQVSILAATELEPETVHKLFLAMQILKHPTNLALLLWSTNDSTVPVDMVSNKGSINDDRQPFSCKQE